MLTHRHWKILDDRLVTNRHLAGGEYGIVDMAFWGWVRRCSRSGPTR